VGNNVCNNLIKQTSLLKYGKERVYLALDEFTKANFRIALKIYNNLIEKITTRNLNSNSRIEVKIKSISLN